MANQARRGIVDRKAISLFYNKSIDKVIEKYRKMDLDAAEFFGTRSTKLETYQEGEVSGVLDVPQRNNDSDQIPLLAPTEGFSQTWTNINRRSGIIVTEDAIETQKHAMLATVLKGLPESAKALEEMAYNQMFTNGFTSETAADGSYLFVSDHPHEDEEFGTWDNRAASAAFSTDSYFEAWLLLQQRKNEKNLPTKMVADVVYYPVAIHEDVMKVAGSDKYPQNSLNAKMPELYGQFRPKSSTWLTSPTAWFVHAKADESQKGFVIVWRKKPNYKPISDPMNPDLIMGRRLKMSFSVGALHARDWIGCAGA